MKALEEPIRIVVIVIVLLALALLLLFFMYTGKGQTLPLFDYIKNLIVGIKTPTA